MTSNANGNGRKNQNVNEINVRNLVQRANMLKRKVVWLANAQTDLGHETLATAVEQGIYYMIAAPNIPHSGGHQLCVFQILDLMNPRSRKYGVWVKFAFVDEAGLPQYEMNHFEGDKGIEMAWELINYLDGYVQHYLDIFVPQVKALKQRTAAPLGAFDYVDEAEAVTPEQP